MDHPLVHDVNSPVHGRYTVFHNLPSVAPTLPAGETVELCAFGHFNCSHDRHGPCHDRLLTTGHRCPRKDCSWEFDSEDGTDG